MSNQERKRGKVNIYQVFTRLFGNTNSNNKPWGAPEENGVGKFGDFTDKALMEIRDLGITHVWYTGVLHHALINDYSHIGISHDDPDVVKGRAGSPYAIKDYYSVNPDLAEDPARGMEEFRDLVDRSHRHGLKVIIDLVPNHVARKYEGKNNPEGVTDFGAADDPSVVYRRDNNFYYIPGEAFKVPDHPDGYLPLGGEKHPLSDGKFDEYPAKWTGNGSRNPQPHPHDWYETVKLNFGVKPDGSNDFPLLPEAFDREDIQAHHAFWQGKSVPNTWNKLKDIAMFWLESGIDGFRFDMAEMVPVEFWSYLNSAIKINFPDALLLAEVYNPDLYRAYLHMGKLDYLYDKVGLYDTLKLIMQGHWDADHIPYRMEELQDIRSSMLHFLENHDEQRIASPEFAGCADKAKPAMVVSAMAGGGPTMIYFGQEVGEPAAENPGFGSPSRTSIFDYVGVPHHQRWMNHGHFDGGQLSEEEKCLRDFYKRLLNFTLNSPVILGSFGDLHRYNRAHTQGYSPWVFSFMRWTAHEQLLVVVNFSADSGFEFEIKIPADVFEACNLHSVPYLLQDQLGSGERRVLNIYKNEGRAWLRMEPLAAYVYKFSAQ